MPLTSDPKRPLTLRDVSEASGVSEMTVSRVLRNKGDVSAATRQKVQDAAKRLGYVPNKIAGALASSRVAKSRRSVRSRFRLPKKRSIGALSQQVPLRLIDGVGLCARSRSW